MGRKMSLGEYAEIAGRWDVGALAGFCEWLAKSDVWVPLPLSVWERYHHMWASGAAPLGVAVAHIG